MSDLTSCVGVLFLEHENGSYCPKAETTNFRNYVQFWHKSNLLSFRYTIHLLKTRKKNADMLLCTRYFWKYVCRIITLSTYNLSLPWIYSQNDSTIKDKDEKSHLFLSYSILNRSHIKIMYVSNSCTGNVS